MAIKIKLNTDEIPDMRHENGVPADSCGNLTLRIFG
jgi:hypothetical protein